MTNQLERLVPDLSQVIRRFPIPVLAAVMLCAYLLIYYSNAAYINQLQIYAGCAAFLAGGAGHIYAEGSRRNRIANILIALALALAAAALMYFNRVFQSAPQFFFGGVVLALMIAPFLRRGVGQGAVWLFNMRLWLAALLAIVVGTVFGLGLSAVLAGLDFLLGFKIDNSIYERVWILATALVAPIFGLSLVPRRLDEAIDITSHQGNLLERGVSLLVSYVMVPLALVYALILHAYAAKIGFLGALPKGEIGKIVSLFAVGGTAPWLIAWPWRETGTRLLRLFMRAWFWLLPIPVILLVMAIWRRLSDYGVTPDRYGIALVAAWAALVFGYLVWRRNKADIRVIVGAAAVLLLIGSFGPQGAHGLTGSSQFARLEALLTRIGVLKDGKVVAVLPSVIESDRRVGSTMVTTLIQANRNGDLKSLFRNDQKFDYVSSDRSRYYEDELINKLGLGIQPTMASNSTKLQDKITIDSVEGFSFQNGQLADAQWNGNVRLIGPMSGFGGVKFGSSNSNNVTAFPGPYEFSVSVGSFVSKISNVDLTSRLAAGIGTINIDNKVTLMVMSANGTRGVKPTVDNITFWIVLHD